LRQSEYFGQYGKILKIVINRRTPNHPGNPTGAGASGGVYITYSKKEDAAKAIEAVDGSLCDGRAIRATFGTTKYCSYYLRNQPCQNTLCQYLHEPGEEADTFYKEELSQNAPTKPIKQTTIKSPPFLMQNIVRKDDKEESALPATASWYLFYSQFYMLGLARFVLGIITRWMYLLLGWVYLININQLVN
jgi:hypothetical protein